MSFAAATSEVRCGSRGRVMAATLSSALTLLAIVTGCAPSHSKSLHPDAKLQRGELQQYGDWVVGCDNRAECTMVGFPKRLPDNEIDPVVSDMAVQITISGHVNSAPKVEIFPFGKTNGKGRKTDGPFVLNVHYDVAVLSAPRGYSRQTLDATEAAGVLRHLGGDTPLLGMGLATSRVNVRFPQADFGRAYRAMQARHAQLRKALADKAIDDLPGELPDGTVMPLPSPLMRFPATPRIVSALVPVDSTVQCGKVPTRDMQYFTFRGGAAMWIFECADRATTRTSYFVMAKDSGSIAQPLDLPEPRDGKIAAGNKGLNTGDFMFDWDFGILRHYQLIDGRSDCGIFRAWGFTQNGWHLIERRDMPLCQGLDPSEWIRTHYTPTDGAAPDA